MNKLNEDAVLSLIRDLPGIKPEPEMRKYRSIYAALRWFTGYTKHLIQTEEIAGVKLCFSLAEKLLKEGNKGVKDAVESEYLCSIVTLVEQQHSPHIMEIFRNYCVDRERACWMKYSKNN